MAEDPSKRPDKKGRKVRIELRKNRGKQERTKKDSLRGIHSADVDEHGDQVASSESVRTKGAHSRKRTIVIREPSEGQAALASGVVVALRGLVVEVDDGRQVWACSVRRMLRTRSIQERHPIAVGDKVRFCHVLAPAGTSRARSAAQDLPEGVIDEIVDRKTTLLRHYERKVQIVAANVDQAAIVMAADQPTLRPHLIDRYLVAIHKGGLRPIICINKMDLDAGGQAAEVLARYSALGYQSIGSSIIDGRGLDALREALANQTSVLAGPSGVGKSSLLNALDPELKLKVGTLTDVQRGRHTTTTARLLKWAFGGYVVDTPGLRQFELVEIQPDEMEAYFVEFVELIQNCRFPSCTHTCEQGCAILAAVEAGQIAAERHESYRRLYQESVERQKEKY